MRIVVAGFGASTLVGVIILGLLGIAGLFVGVQNGEIFVSGFGALFLLLALLWTAGYVNGRRVVRMLKEGVHISDSTVYFPVLVDVGKVRGLVTWHRNNKNIRYVFTPAKQGVQTVCVDEICGINITPSEITGEAARFRTLFTDIFVSIITPVSVNVDEREVAVVDGESAARATLCTSGNVLEYMLSLSAAGSARSARLEFDFGQIRTGTSATVVAGVERGSTTTGRYAFPSPQGPVLLVYTSVLPEQILASLRKVLGNMAYYVNKGEFYLRLVLDIPLAPDKQTIIHVYFEPQL